MSCRVALKESDSGLRVYVVTAAKYKTLVKRTQEPAPTPDPATGDDKIFARGRTSPLTFYIDPACTSKLRRMIEVGDCPTSSSDVQEEGGEVVDAGTAFILLVDEAYLPAVGSEQRALLNLRSAASFLVTPSYVAECVVKDRVLDPTPFLLRGGIPR